MADDNNRGQAVSLGCGTLILIALIVMFFSNRGDDDVKHELRGLRDEVKREIRGLRTEVIQLRAAVKDQTALIKGLQAKPEVPPPEALKPDDEGAK